MTPIIYKNHVLVPEARAQLFAHQGVGQRVNFKGHDFRVLPHDVKHTSLLWKLGVNELPAPIKTDGYDWPGRFDPMQHQLESAAFKVMHPRCFDLSGLGTGKTASSIWAAEYLIRQGLIEKVGIVAPLSCLQRVWEDEIFNLTPNRQAVIVHGGKVKRERAMASKAHYYIVNHDGVKTAFKGLMDLDIDLWIVDEFTAFKTHNSDRSKCMNKLARKRPDTRLWMMSGTPTPQSPEDAYFPCKMVNTGMTTRLGRFRDATMIKVNDYKWVPRHNAQEVVQSFMQPAILIKKSDVLDLPPVTYVRRQAELTDSQKNALKQLKIEKSMQLTADRESGRVSIANAAAMLGKVLQTLQGCVITDAGVRHEFKCEPRLKLVTELINQASAKAVVFAPYTGPLRILRNYLEEYFSVGFIDGSVSESKRSEIYKSFQETDDIQVLVAHPRTTSHGLTLTAADLTVWYGPTFSTETYLQANQRMDRPGQTKPMTIAQIGAAPEEWAVYKALSGNADMQQTLLDLYSA